MTSTSDHPQHPRAFCRLKNRPALFTALTPALLCALTTHTPAYAEPPEITNHDGNAEVIIASPENQPIVTTINAIDMQGGAVSYSLGGGADQQHFSIDSDSGQLSFKVAPDFENPLDADQDNQYEVIVSAQNPQNESTTQALSININDDKQVQLQLKAWLQGAYNTNTGLMRDELIAQGILPLRQPYHARHFGYYGDEILADSALAVTGDNAVVDWVLLELRDPDEPGNVVHTQALILQRDGDIVDPATGSADLSFSLEHDGYQRGYIVGLRHRNHLGVMTAAPVTLSDSPTLIDFTSAQTIVAGDNARAAIAGQQMLWVGDLQHDKRIISNGPGSDANAVLAGILSNSDNTQYNANFLFSGYNPLDLNMDGRIIFSGPDNDTTLLLANTLLHPENPQLNANFIVQGYLADAPDVLPVSSEQEAARFLTQATFGATTSSINELLAMGSYEAWLDQQFALPITRHYPAHLAFLADAEKDIVSYNEFHGIWRNQALYAPDQLRQRTAYALSQIMVVSIRGGGLSRAKAAIGHYHDLLAEHAFGNFRELLEAVTLNPVMGRYLNMLRNRKADPARNIHPDENFAREVMQLFTIGLHQLNPDGTPKLDANGATIPTYTQEDIEGLAAVFTGWTFAGVEKFWQNNNDFVSPMVGWPDYHQSGDKRFIDGHIINEPTMEAELEQVLDILFNHPNVAPFISKQLIQRLVTSNPTPAYVERVSRVFADNGSGVRGDLAAVVRAILLDQEARYGHRSLPQQFGKLKEPLIRQMAFWRALGGQPSVAYRFSPNYHLSQGAYESPSVFNFFRPDYTPEGSMGDKPWVMPELQIATEDQLTRSRNYMLNATGKWNETPADHPNEVVIDLTQDSVLVLEDPAVLIERYNLLLMSGSMSPAMKNVLLRYLDQRKSRYDAKKLVARLLFLITGSSQQAVQR